MPSVVVAPTAVVYPGVEFLGHAFVGEFALVGHPTAVASSGARASASDWDEYVREVSKDDSRVSIGAGATIRAYTVIYARVTIGEQFDSGHHVVVREGCVLGRNVYLKSHTHLMKSVEIGDDCRISAIIADGSRVGRGTAVFGILTHRDPKVYSRQDGPWFGPQVGEDCLIARGAVVLGPCQIGNRSIVAPGAVVSRDVPDDSIVVGRPATIRRRPRK